MRLLKMLVVAIILATVTIEGAHAGFDLMNIANDGAVFLGTVLVAASAVLPFVIFRFLLKKGWL